MLLPIHGDFGSVGTEAFRPLFAQIADRLLL